MNGIKGGSLVSGLTCFGYRDSSNWAASPPRHYLS